MWGIERSLSTLVWMFFDPVVPFLGDDHRPIGTHLHTVIWARVFTRALPAVKNWHHQFSVESWSHPRPMCMLPDPPQRESEDNHAC